MGGFPVVWHFGIDILPSFPQQLRSQAFAMGSAASALTNHYQKELDDIKNEEGFFWRGKIHRFVRYLFVLFGLQMI